MSKFLFKGGRGKSLKKRPEWLETFENEKILPAPYNHNLTFTCKTSLLPSHVLPSPNNHFLAFTCEILLVKLLIHLGSN